MEGMRKGGEEWGREGKERQRDREETDKEMERFFKCLNWGIWVRNREESSVLLVKVSCESEIVLK